MGDNFLLTITASVCLRQEAFNGLMDYVLDVTVPFVTILVVQSTFSEIQNADGRRDIYEPHIISYVSVYTPCTKNPLFHLASFTYSPKV